MRKTINKNKEFTTSQSIKIVKDIMKDKSSKVNKKNLAVGDLFFGVYDARNKEEVYNKRPFVLLLAQNSRHMLGISFSWAPLPLRVVLVKKILSLNRKNIKEGKRLEFSYKQLKPFLKRIGFAPIIRKYIISRMSSGVVLIPPEHLMTAARLQTAVFTDGKRAEELYKRALAGNKKYRSTRKRRE